ncbi:lysophospholipid acyltransferase family protein [Patescibacteria group bacterium]
MKKIYFLPVIITQWIIRLITKAIFSVFCNLKVEGLENLKDVEAPVIFAANHASEWDGPLVRTVMPMISKFAPMFYVGMDKEFYRTKKFGLRGYFYGSGLFKLVGAYPIYFGLKDYKKSLRNHIRILEDCGSITIFPEGRCSRDGKIGEFKAGVIALAHYTKVNIVPVHISGTYCLSIKAILSKKRNVTIKFGNPHKINIDLEQSKKEPIEIYKNKAAELRESILKLHK